MNRSLCFRNSSRVMPNLDDKSDPGGQILNIIFDVDTICRSSIFFISHTESTEINILFSRHDLRNKMSFGPFAIMHSGLYQSFKASCNS